jgi:hypothetical protein
MECRAGASYPCPDHDCLHALKSSAGRRSSEVQELQ